MAGISSLQKMPPQLPHSLFYFTSILRVQDFKLEDFLFISPQSIQTLHKFQMLYWTVRENLRFARQFCIVFFLEIFPRQSTKCLVVHKSTLKPVRFRNISNALTSVSVSVRHDLLLWNFTMQLGNIDKFKSKRQSNIDSRIRPLQNAVHTSREYISK